METVECLHYFFAPSPFITSYKEPEYHKHIQTLLFLYYLFILEIMLYFGLFSEQNLEVLADIDSEVRIDICEHAG